MIDQFTPVAKTASGGAYLSADRKTLVVRFSTLADTKGAADLMRMSRQAVLLNKVQVFVTDAQEAEGASFDAIWRVEACLSNLRHAESIREWRHVPSDSAVLHIALRRMVRQVQAQGLFCGVYPSLGAALVAQGGCLIEGQSGMLHSPTGVVADTGRYLLAEFGGEVPANMLDVHLDVLAYALQGNVTPRVVLRLLVGARIPKAGLLTGLRRILNIGSNPIVAVVDEARLLKNVTLPESDGGMCYLSQDMAAAEAMLPELGLDKFRLGAPGPARSIAFCDCALAVSGSQPACEPSGACRTTKDVVVQVTNPLAER